MRRFRVVRFGILAVVAISALLMSVLPAFAQAGTPEVNPNANISFPPPVYVVSGDVEIIGSANLPNMRNYFVTVRALDHNFQPISDEFFPAILPQASAVRDDVLGLWDTTDFDDGIYEIRLSIAVRNSRPVNVSVFPIRIENEGRNNNGGRPPVTFPTATPTRFVPTFPTATPTRFVPVFPTASPTQFNPTPRVIIASNVANIRGGDSTAHPVVAQSRQGQEYRVVGISSTGSNWYQIQLPSGALGWISPTVVTTAGNMTGIPFVVPPPLPTPTPSNTPTITPTPTATIAPSPVNLVPGVITFIPAPPVCNTEYIAQVQIFNNGSLSSIPTNVTLVDTRVVDGSVQGSTTVAVPMIAPGSNIVVNIPITISTWFNEIHRTTITVDSSNAIVEMNEADNVTSSDYVLQQGACS